MLSQAAALSASTLNPSAANPIWLRAQAQRQELVLVQAARVMMILRVACVLYAAVFATWCVRVAWHSQASSMTPLFSALASQPVCVGAAIAVTTGALGAGCLLLLGKRDGSLIPMN
jgi:hypothetical protein